MACRFSSFSATDRHRFGKILEALRVPRSRHETIIDDQETYVRRIVRKIDEPPRRSRKSRKQTPEQAPEKQLKKLRDDLRKLSPGAFCLLLDELDLRLPHVAPFNVYRTLLDSLDAARNRKRRRGASKDPDVQLRRELAATTACLFEIHGLPITATRNNAWHAWTAVVVGAVTGSVPKDLGEREKRSGAPHDLRKAKKLLDTVRERYPRDRYPGLYRSPERFPDDPEELAKFLREDPPGSIDLDDLDDGDLRKHAAPLWRDARPTRRRTP